MRFVRVVLSSAALLSLGVASQAHAQLNLLSKPYHSHYTPKDDKPATPAATPAPAAPATPAPAATPPAPVAAANPTPPSPTPH